MIGWLLPRCAVKVVGFDCEAIACLIIVFVRLCLPLLRRGEHGNAGNKHFCMTTRTPTTCRAVVQKVAGGAAA